MAFERGEFDVFEAIRRLDQGSQMDSGQRKSEGVVYTPTAIASSMCSMSGHQLGQSVLEPSCGRGVFVFALAEFHLAQGREPDECARALAQGLRACDIDASAIDDLRRLWPAYWRSKGAGSPPIAATREDFLFGSARAGRFDLALGNPPYVRFQHLAPAYREQLRARYATCASGNVDLYYAFVEQCLSQAERSCLIVPNSWMINKSGRALRDLLRARALRLLDYGDELVFAPARAYVCVLLAQSNPRPPGSPAPILHQDAALLSEQGWVEAPSDDQRFASSGWATRHPKAPSAHAPAHARRLDQIADIHSGYATLADKLYAIDGAAVEDGSVVFFDPLCQRELRVSLALAPRRAKLTKIKSERALLDNASRILAPYDAQGRILSEDVLREEHPDAWDFLAARKKPLAARDKGAQDGYEAWFAFGRKQGLKALPAGPLCSVAGMGQGRIEHFLFDGAAAGRFLFTSGFVVAPKPGHTREEIAHILALPASWSFMLARGKEWAGADGKVYRSFGSKLLGSLPTP